MPGFSALLTSLNVYPQIYPMTQTGFNLCNLRHLWMPPHMVRRRVATIGYALGLPLDQVIFSPTKRPFTVADKGQPLTHLFA